MMNIVWVSQLDEAGYHIDIEEGAVKVHELGGWLLAKVMRGENRMYILHAKLVWPVCLAARGVKEAWKCQHGCAAEDGSRESDARVAGNWSGGPAV